MTGAGRAENLAASRAVGERDDRGMSVSDASQYYDARDGRSSGETRGMAEETTQMSAEEAVAVGVVPVATACTTWGREPAEV